MNLILKFRMKEEKYGSFDVQDIDELYVYLENTGMCIWIKKEDLYDKIVKEGISFYVNATGFPLAQAVDREGTKYVRSTPNKYNYDNIIALPQA